MSKTTPNYLNWRDSFAKKDEDLITALKALSTDDLLKRKRELIGGMTREVMTPQQSFGDYHIAFGVVQYLLFERGIGNGEAADMTLEEPVEKVKADSKNLLPKFLNAGKQDFFILVAPHMEHLRSAMMEHNMGERERNTLIVYGISRAILRVKFDDAEAAIIDERDSE